ncbi:MAG TPA: LamG domain-containing protein [Verrucomicrobiae bacterium]|nr:LamG domain-containing protein [Verrucomicrobiae bacterium]
MVASLGRVQSAAPKSTTWWSFSSDRQQGASIKPWYGGPSIKPSGGFRFSAEPPPGRIELSGRDERLLVANSVAEAELPKQDLTIEAWVRVDEAQDWGGIFSAIQDNGDFERGLLLGYRQDHFCLAVATEAAGKLTYLSADTAFMPGRWHHVVGTYDGKVQRIFVDGRLSGESTAQSGPVWYAPSGPVVVGSYEDNDENYRMKGALEEVHLYQQALSPEDVAARFAARSAEFPEPAPEPVQLALPYGPFVDFVDRTTALVTWETETEMPTRLELFSPSGDVVPFGDETPTIRHELRLAGLERDTEYRFRLIAPELDGVEQVTPRYILDTSFYYQPVAVPKAAAELMAGRTDEASIARQLLERSGVRQGWAYVLGADDGRVALELVRQSDLKLVIVEADGERVMAVRRFLSAAGVYGVRASVQHVTGDELPYGASLANLILSEATLKTGEPPRWSATEVHRLLRPAGGVALFGRPSGEASPAWNQWLSGGELAGSRRDTTAGWWSRYERERLAGAGDWSHQYGSANNSSSSMDELVRGDLEVSWWGEPGPRPMPDRGPRNPAPLSVNGRLYIQGDRILFGLDAYNGSVLWSVITPEVRRTNLPRDSSNTTADDTTLYVAHNAYCLEFDGQTGARGRRHSVPDDSGDRQYDWGYLSVTDGHLIGSRVRSGSRYRGDDGEWYEHYEPDQISRVVSDTLFGSDLGEDAVRWEYQRGAIINSTITIGDNMIFFIESRNPAAMNAPSGRVHPDLLTDTHLVALDLRSGAKLWDEARDFSKLQYMAYLVYNDHTVVATGTDKDKNFHTYAFTAPAPVRISEAPQTVVFGGQPLWSDDHMEDKGHHSGHLQHPVVVDGVFYSDQRAFDLKTGEVVRRDLPERRGCGTMSAGRHALFFRHYFHGMWDLDTDKRTQFEGIRGGCWLGLIPAGGMLLAPESSAGCSCTHAIQTSVGYSPKLRSLR